MSVLVRSCAADVAVGCALPNRQAHLLGRMLSHDWQKFGTDETAHLARSLDDRCGLARVKLGVDRHNDRANVPDTVKHFEIRGAVGGKDRHSGATRDAVTAQCGGDRRFSASVRTVERGSFGPVLQSSTVDRLRHFATVLELIPNSRLACASEACDRCIPALTACVVVALP